MVLPRLLALEEASVGGDFSVKSQFAVHELLEFQDLRGQLGTELLDFSIALVDRQAVQFGLGKEEEGGRWGCFVVSMRGILALLLFDKSHSHFWGGKVSQLK